MILYPTETIYGLGVNPFNETALQALFDLKGRDERKVSSWLVRSIEDIDRYAEVSALAEKLIRAFLPGPLTLVLPATSIIPPVLQSDAGTIGLRISADPIAQQVVTDHFAVHDAPLTCTSANISGLPTAPTPDKIIAQFSEHRSGFSTFDQVYDDGPRSGAASTVIKVVGDTYEIIRSGAIAPERITEVAISARSLR